MAEPTVTVLMPVYNGASYLPTAVESVLAQSFGDFELLTVDDCSTDDSLEVLRGFGDPRIRILRNEANLGQVATVNRGLAAAAGRYVARLDQDDVALPRRLERQVAVLDEETDVAVVGGWIDVVDEAGRVVATEKGDVTDLTELVYLLLVHRLPIAHSAVTFRRDEVVALGGYDEAFRLAEDMDLWRRLALRGREARVVQEVVVRYLVHAGSQSAQRYDEQLANSFRSLEAFMTELAPASPVADLRALFTLDPATGTDVDLRPAMRALPAFAAAAAARLGLDAARLERLLRREVAVRSRKAWRAPRDRRPPPAGLARGAWAAAPILRLLRGGARRAWR